MRQSRSLSHFRKQRMTEMRVSAPMSASASRPAYWAGRANGTGARDGRQVPRACWPAPGVATPIRITDAIVTNTWRGPFAVMLMRTHSVSDMPVSTEARLRSVGV
jgi:hypothetical protein